MVVYVGMAERFIYYLIRNVIVAFAAVGGALLWQISPEVTLVIAFGFGTVGTLGFVVFGRDEQVPMFRSGLKTSDRV